MSDEFKNCDIRFEAPNKNLYFFKGSVENQSIPELNLTLTNKNLVLRGSSLANTDWIVGLPIYMGSDTKLMKNAG